jgi:O-acetyl-ADP-ribose deacetylase (regulator of RNase III)
MATATIEDTRDSFNATVADLCRDLDLFLRSDAAAPYVIPKKKTLTHFQRSVVELAEAIAEMPACLLPPTAAVPAASAEAPTSTDAIAKSDAPQGEIAAGAVVGASSTEKSPDNAEAAAEDDEEKEKEDDPVETWVWYARQTLRALFISTPAPLTAALPASVFAAHESLLKDELDCAEEDGEVPDVERDFRPLLAGAGASASAAEADAAYPIVVWRGDMSRLRVDAMVNPANSALMGCFLPAHKCLDNILHAQAGIRLRAECHAMFAREGIDPRAGDANGRCRVTPACALPATWVFHTIGPDLNEVVKGKHHLRAPTDVDRAELASCYTECYRAAVRLGARSVAFCCISTGVFGYPQVDAARIAIQTVKDEMDAAAAAGAACRPLVVFNVFAPADLTIYSALVKEIFPSGAVPVIGGGVKA